MLRLEVPIIRSPSPVAAMCQQLKSKPSRARRRPQRTKMQHLACTERGASVSRRKKKVGHDNGMTFLTCRLKSEEPKTIWRREVADWKVDPVLSEGCTQKPRTMLCTLGTRCAFLRRTQVSIESVVFVDK